MDWNAKWDWESLVSFNPKTTENSKLLTTNWGIEGEEELIVTEPFRLYEGKGNSSGSEVAPGSSARSSISVCTDSSFIKNTHVAFGNINVFSEDIEKKKDFQSADHDESPPPLESSVGSGESLIGLKLGKRMYFENNNCTKTACLAEAPVSSISSTVKKIKSSNLNTPSRCQVEGCNLDLSSAKEYHRKHKVCASHSRFPKVVVGGLERRFCQQCSRFHSLSEFDEKKRSCRRRLSDHNARRRKPQLDPMQFNRMKMPLPISAYTCTDGTRQLSFVSNNIPPIYSKASSDSTWESSFGSEFENTKGCLLKFGKNRDLDEQLQLRGTQSPHAITLPGHSFSRLLPSKGTKSGTLTRGCKESALPRNLESAPDFHRALSLLSNDTWGSFSSANNSLDHSINFNRMHHQPLMQGFTQNFPQTDHHSTNSLTATANDTSHFPLFKAPYENVLYSNLFN